MRSVQPHDAHMDEEDKKEVTSVHEHAAATNEGTKEGEVSDGSKLEDHPAALYESEDKLLPGFNVADAAYCAMDMMMGIASVIPEDYPFVCVCLDTGMCDENL